MPLGRTSTIFWSRFFALPVKVSVPVGLTSCPVAGSAVMPIVTSAAAMTAIVVLRAITVLLLVGRGLSPRQGYPSTASPRLESHAARSRRPSLRRSRGVPVQRRENGRYAFDAVRG